MDKDILWLSVQKKRKQVRQHFAQVVQWRKIRILCKSKWNLNQIIFWAHNICLHSFGPDSLGLIFPFYFCTTMPPSIHPSSRLSIVSLRSTHSICSMAKWHQNQSNVYRKYWTFFGALQKVGRMGGSWCPFRMAEQTKAKKLWKLFT